jgi:bifunctional non-homologous end joining protein LigD
VRPEVVVEIAYGEWTSEGRLRHPVYLGERTDVDPAAVVRPPSPA